MIALALVAGAIGALLAASTLQRLDVGETWRDWQSARSPGWFTAMQVVLVVIFLGGMVLARPVELKVVLLGVPGGFCLVYFSIGIRRRFGKTTGPGARPPLEPDPLEVEDDLEEPEVARGRAPGRLDVPAGGRDRQREARRPGRGLDPRLVTSSRARRPRAARASGRGCAGRPRTGRA